MKPSSEYYKSGALEHGYITLSLVIDKKGRIKYKNETLSISEYLNKIPPRAFPIVAHGFALDLYFDQNFTFQDYISFKSELYNFIDDEIILSYNQFIY